jgi:hypothetical protein
MFEQLFESLRKASESSLMGQQQLFDQWTQQWPSQPLGTAGAGAGAEWVNTIRKRWTDSLSEGLNRHREIFDSTYRNGIQLIEQALRVSDVKSGDEYKRSIEDLWRKVSDTAKDQVETQLRELHKTAERWLELAHKNQP